MQNLSLPDFIPNVTFLKGIPRPYSASRREKPCAMHARLCAICCRTDRVRCTYRIYLLTSKKQFYILFIPFISIFIFPQFYSYFPKIYLQYHRFKGYYIFIFANMQQVKNASIVLSFLLVSLSAYDFLLLKSPTRRFSKCSKKVQKTADFLRNRRLNVVAGTGLEPAASGL